MHSFLMLVYSMLQYVHYNAAYNALSSNTKQDRYISYALNRLACKNFYDQRNITLFHSGENLFQLRQAMLKRNISAYIIPTSDDHQTEFVGLPDRRVEFLTGFSGSEGIAVITLSKAALWTDSRYHVQADHQLDCDWLLFKSTGDSGGVAVPTLEEWIASELNYGDKVSADPKIIQHSLWLKWNNYFSHYGIWLEMIKDNLVDTIWKARPHYPNSNLTVHDLKYTGETWQNKLARVRKIMAEHYVNTCIITGLDEIAWALNLRGNDVPHTPVFRAYLIISKSSATLYLPSEKLTQLVQSHLTSPKDVVIIVSYDRFWHDLTLTSRSSRRIWIPSSVGYAKGASYLIYQSIPQSKLFLAPSPLINLMAYKNDIESEGMLKAHIRDAIAICELWAVMEKEIQDGTQWDELKVSTVLKNFRSKQPLNRGESFESIVAFGTNSALPHYIPKVQTNKKVDNTSLLMIDSGGQYLDGTCDTTRVFSFGTPTAFQRQVYTALLQGCIDLVTTVFPQGQTIQDLEIIIRRPLFNMGLRYGHGSTHGVGVYLSVHESFNYTYGVNFFGSQEPGYYKENDFGVRMENVVQVIPSVKKENSDTVFLTFQTITLVPYENKLIDFETLDYKQVHWFKSYNKRIRNLVGGEMIKQGKVTLYQWLVEKTDIVF